MSLYKRIAVLLLFCAACRTQREYTARPSRSIINPDSDLLEVNATAYHVNDSITEIYTEVVNENLIYKRPDTTIAFYAELRISWKLQSDQNSRKIIDSGSYYMNDRAMDKVEVQSLYGKFNLKAKRGAEYYLEINVYDLNKKVKYKKTLNVYKQNNFSAQNFLVKKENRVSLNNRFVAGEEIRVTVPASVSQLTVDCFLKEFPPAAPPFSLKAGDEFKYKPDSSFALSLSGEEFRLNMPAYGFYHVRTSAASQEGLTLHAIDKSFPGVSNSNEMIHCTRYLMNKDEFDKCKNAQDQKSCIDHFWLTIGGSNERARELLKRYYGRVKEANKYYSSYTEGWKTDRGMIFIMFGMPTNIYKGPKSETWLYGLESNPNAVRYTFHKTKNPFSDNDYVLERSQFYKDHWYMAADVWRNGHVYIDQGR